MFQQPRPGNGVSFCLCSWENQRFPRRYRSVPSPACICLRKRNPWLHTGIRMFPRKEVIQPHLPVRLPCYDFTPVTNPALGRCFQLVSSRTSGVVDFHGVTGGVYKTRERIQRSVLICACWSAFTSDSDFMHSSCRVQSELRPAFRDLLTLAGSLLVVPAIVTRV